MNDKRIRIGIVGAGNIAREVNLPNLLAIPDVEVVAVCNARPETARQVAAQFGIPTVVDEWISMVGREDVDAIWIGTPPILHAAVTIAALERGKHVFSQARMAMDLAEARSMAAAADSRPDLVTMLSPPPMGMKAGKLFEKLIADGYVGAIHHVRLVADSAMFADPDAPLHWRQRRELVGRNIMAVGIYLEIITRWLGAPVRLHARTRVSVPERAGQPIEVPDVVHVSTQWHDGAVGNLEWSGVALFPPPSTLTVHGQDATLVYDFDTDEIRGGRRGEAALHTFDLPADLETRWSVEQDFIDAVRNGGRPEPSFATGLAYMELTEAVHLSAASGCDVHLPLP